MHIQIKIRKGHRMPTTELLELAYMQAPPTTNAILNSIYTTPRGQLLVRLFNTRPDLATVEAVFKHKQQYLVPYSYYSEIILGQESRSPDHPPIIVSARDLKRIIVILWYLNVKDLHSDIGMPGHPYAHNPRYRTKQPTGNRKTDLHITQEEYNDIIRRVQSQG